MPSESSEKIFVVTPLQTPPKLTEPLPCPRCNSANTKFCYFNNYNLSQPRHFCKGCRRYWTQGGTLRNVPVGGGTRKNSKRSRSSNTANSPSSSSTTTASNSNISTLTHEAETLPVSVTANTSQVSPPAKAENSDRHGLSFSEKEEGYCAMLNTQGHGFIDPFVNGLGFCEMGIGFGGKGVWSYPGLSYICGGVGNDEGMGSGSAGCNSWQLSDVGSLGEGLSVHGESDGFAWPGLTISAPGKSLK